MIIHLVSDQTANKGFTNQLSEAITHLGHSLVATDLNLDQANLPGLLAQKADLLLCCNCIPIDPQLLEAAPCVTALWCNEQLGTNAKSSENTLALRAELARNISAFDYIICTDPGSLPYYLSLGAKRVHALLRAAAEPDGIAQQSSEHAPELRADASHLEQLINLIDFSINKRIWPSYVLGVPTTPQDQPTLRLDRFNDAVKVRISHLGAKQHLITGYFAKRSWCKENQQTIRYLQLFPQLYMHDTRFWEYPFVFSVIRDRPGSKIIDIGCGKGAFAAFLAKQGHKVVGVDNYESCWREMEHEMRETGLQFVNADARNLQGFQAGEFDIALLISAIEHIPSNTIYCEKKQTMKTAAMLREENPEKLKVISEALRVLKPGGLLVITSDYYLDYPMEVNISWRELLGVQGLEIDQATDTRDLYIADNPAHKGRILPLAIVIEKHDYLEVSNLAIISKNLRDGEYYFTRGDFFQAKGFFQAVLADDPKHLEALNKLGGIFLQEGDPDEALHHFQEALRVDANNLCATENIGKCFDAKGNYIDALNWYKKVLHQARMNTTILNNMGHCFIELNDLKTAKLVYHESLKIDSHQQHVKSILTMLEEGSPTSPDPSPDIKPSRIRQDSYTGSSTLQVSEEYKLALIYKQFGDLTQSISIFEQLTASGQASLSIYRLLGELYFKTGRNEDAVRMYQEMLKDDPYHADAWYSLGLIYQKSLKPDAAADAWQRCLMLKPDHQDVRLALRCLPVEKIKPIIASAPVISLTAFGRPPLKLVAKDYSNCELQYEGRKLYIVRGNNREWFRINLVGAQWSNHPWGFENDLFDTLTEMGFDVVDTDYRKDSRYIAQLLNQDVHMTFVQKGEGLPPDLIAGIPGVTVLWYPDDLLATQHGPRDVAYNGAAYDMVYGYGRWDLKEYKKYGVKNVRWLPAACLPSLHRKLNIAKIHDVTFIGNLYENRIKLLERLAKRFNVLVKNAFRDEMVEIFNKSKIVLNLGIGQGSIPHRIFEALACGSFLLTNEIPKEDRLFRDRVHLVYFNDQNIEDLVAYYLAHEKEREAIANRGRAEVLKHHTVRHRMETILKDTFKHAGMGSGEK